MKMPYCSIAREMGVHYSVVKRILAGNPILKVERGTKTAMYLPLIQELLKKYPNIRATRIHVLLVERGYPCGVRRTRTLVSKLRPKKVKSECQENFLRGHLAAFEFFGGVPRQVWTDNLKSAVLERRGDAIRFNPGYLAFAGSCLFEPRPVAIRRGNEKGRVERAIRYIRDNFWPAREWKDLTDLNTQARNWCLGESGKGGNLFGQASNHPF